MRNLLLLCAFATLGCRPDRDPAEVMALTGDLARGEAMYQMRCANCHGAEGNGYLRAPSLVVKVPELSEQEMLAVILNGKGGMPAQRIDDQQVADVNAWLQKTWGKPAAAK